VALGASEEHSNSEEGAPPQGKKQFPLASFKNSRPPVGYVILSRNAHMSLYCSAVHVPRMPGVFLWEQLSPSIQSLQISLSGRSI
jgi:hypothetical protein